MNIKTLKIRDSMQKILYTGQKDGKILKWNLLKVFIIYENKAYSKRNFRCKEIKSKR